jgi:D-arabinono-1,4-lactone oxidase/FAD binding domain-containing protein
MIPRGSDGFYHPATEGELRELIAAARSSGGKLRVRGAGHSEPGAYEAGPGGFDVLLNKMNGVEFDDATMQVTVQAGCHLGVDPEDPSGTSTRENSLLTRLDQRGWALPTTGGITRQTVAGFLMTGSAGGTLEHSAGDLIVKLRVMDGDGAVHEFTRNDDPGDPFYAAGLSMGLLGVVTSVTLQCVPRFIVEGEERTSSYDDCEIDLFGDAPGRQSLEAFLRETEHCHVLLWPQKGVRKASVWKAQSKDLPAVFEPKPYEQVSAVLGSTWPAYAGLSLAFRLLDGLNPPAPRGILARRFERGLGLLYQLVAGSALKPAHQQFRDWWWRGLPKDDQANYRLLPIAFTEIWVPLERTLEAMQRLRRHYEEGGFPATGVYACELYATPQSKFWMSPAYRGPVLKVDTFWFNKSEIDPHQHFYPQFWDLLKDLSYTLHWGKALSGDVDYLRQQYPRWDDFLAVREKMDPDQVFVTDYWRRHLGIAPAG